MKAIIFILTFVMSSGYIYSQSLTKEEALNSLKETLQGQMMHSSGGPCTNYSSHSYFTANQVTINKITYTYSNIVIEYTAGGGEHKTNNVKRINMNNHFVIYSDCIFESSKDLGENGGNCDDFTNMALAFDDNTKPAQERSLKILRYLKKFSEKDPFEN